MFLKVLRGHILFSHLPLFILIQLPCFSITSHLSRFSLRFHRMNIIFWGGEETSYNHCKPNSNHQHTFFVHILTSLSPGGVYRTGITRLTYLLSLKLHSVSKPIHACPLAIRFDEYEPITRRLFLMFYSQIWQVNSYFKCPSYKKTE